MIKFIAHDETTNLPIVGLGLSDGNLERLRQGKPIVIDLQKMNPLFKGNIIIFWGPTEQAMADYLRDTGKIGPTTEVKESIDEQ